MDRPTVCVSRTGGIVSTMTWRDLLAVSCFCIPLACTQSTSQTITEIDRVCGVGPADSLAVTVEFSTCLSSSCDTVESAQCTLREANGVVTVEGMVEITSESGSCTSDCGIASAECSIELPPGDYTLDHAGRQATITLPTSDTVCTVDD